MPPTVTTSRDPVCGMDVATAKSSHSSRYRGLIFHFCSAQCRQCFDANPNLYAGAQRIADIKPMVKRHKLRLAGGAEVALQDACRRLGEMMGVAVLATAPDYLLVEYDLRQATLPQIEAALAAAGVALKGGLHGLRRGLWKFTEANELQNAANPAPAACCSRPPVRLR